LDKSNILEDFVKALVILGEREEALGRAWLVPNDRPQITQRQFAELVFAETGHPVKARGMGKTMMRIGGLFIPGARETVEMMYEFEKPFVVDSSQFEMTRPLEGDIPDAPLPEGLEVRAVTPDRYRQICDADIDAFRESWGFAVPSPDDYEQ
jgi:hypothetical protein